MTDEEREAILSQQRQRQYDLEALSYEDPSLYKAVMDKQAAENAAFTAANPLPEFGTLTAPGGTYQSGKTRMNFIESQRDRPVSPSDQLPKLVGGGEYGMGVGDFAGGGFVDAFDGWKYLKGASQRNRDARALLTQELVDEGYSTGSMDFYKEFTKRLPEPEGSGEALFDVGVGVVEGITLGAAKPVTAPLKFIVKGGAARFLKGLSAKLTTRAAPSGRGALPTANTAAEDMARKILELRAAGKADEVTEAMMSAADNPYMYANTPLDMSQEARMARADEMFPRKGFHGTNADIDTFQGNVFSTDNPTLASTYARGSADAQIYPLRLGSKLGDAVVEGKGKNWNQFDIDELYESNPELANYVRYGFSSFGDESMSTSTRDIEQAAKSVGLSGVQFKDIYDTGPGFNSNQFKNLGYTKEQERALQKQYMEDLSKPSNVDVRLSPNLVRSEFARFDPEFRNLRNLSASILSAIGFTGLAASLKDEERGGGI